jgi:hypothetical protein
MFDFEQNNVKEARNASLEDTQIFKSTDLTCEYLRKETDAFVDNKDFMFSFQEREKSFYSETPQDFIEYLDNYFKPEIDLSEKKLFETAPIETKASKINIFYRGQKNNFVKGKNAERKDVIHKTLLRGIRRFLWEKFTNEYDLSIISKVNSATEYRKSLRSFIEERFFNKSS